MTPRYGHPSTTINICRVFGAIAALLAGGAIAAAQTVGIVVTGPEQMVYRWQTDRCAPWHVPDTPARALRGADGRVLLFAVHHENRLFAGPSLDSVRPNCGVVFAGGHRDAPEAFDDRGWLAAPYTLDGRTIFALVHNEYQGHQRPALCPSGKYQSCWSNSITAAMSNDGGRGFAAAAAPGSLVAALPYRYRGDIGRPVGLFSPTGIVAHEGFYYVMVFAEAYEAQRRGTCVLRTDRLDDPRSWRAWDGAGFSVAFADAYREDIADPQRHVCAPVSPGRMGSTVTSLVRDRATGLFIALMAGAAPAAPGRPAATGFYAAVSRDMIAWSVPQLIWPAPVMWKFACDDPAIYAYPSLIDPASPSRNFEDVGATAYVYATRFNPSDCKLAMDRDLVRLPVRIVVDAAPR